LSDKGRYCLNIESQNGTHLILKSLLGVIVSVFGTDLLSEADWNEFCACLERAYGTDVLFSGVLKELSRGFWILKRLGEIFQVCRL